ncbi:hypothetical protein O7598_31220 [Micromonospora sp. WMMC241]|uniref:hypothetical protein n=1 Tax=Micromonospora sp. WMMC241 TaxID=3015159 RepID=UPI0022B6F070|nr:hypothetical protein [Micromonospora sp. WMMC241]MCZ7434793.1 hypothetical protein [Micromonospora sp. WMMC241]MCZ7440848.1 hypothetical protein [Micromonospora sp. WMMC241]MCZ7440897.1 hypothetical protein [Micromonospora sp. WMMC241]
MPVGDVVTLTALGTCVIAAALLLADALAELRREGNGVADTARAATTAIHNRAKAVHLTHAQEAELARFRAWIDDTSPAAFTWKDLLP